MKGTSMAEQTASRKKRMVWIAAATVLMLMMGGIGTLVAIVMWNMVGRGPGALVAATKARARVVQQCVDSYHTETGSYPATIGQLVPTYLPRLEPDAWGRPLMYAPTPMGPMPYDLRSAGADGVFNTIDDVDVWKP